MKLVNWAVVAAGVIIVGALFFVPVISGPIDSYSVSRAAELCGSTFGGILVSQDACQYVPMVFYGGLIVAVILIIAGFVSKK
jgi:hypothetical protein